MVSKYYVGTSGWHYEHWRGRFYPTELPKSKWLEFYTRSFGTVELNNSFYHLPSEKAFANWRDFSPQGFCIYDMPDLTTPLEATADFVYVRFHGSTWLYGGSYSDDKLSKWAENISELARGKKAAYIYFNNDAEAFAVQNALTMEQKLKVK